MSGYRKGTKRSDRRWVDDQGRQWDARFEWLVYTALESAGYNLRRSDERDTIDYSSQVRGGYCLDCDSSRVVQGRTYNSDIYVLDRQPEGIEGGYLLELKGYFPATKRSLFRAVAKQCEADGVDLRIIFESGNKMRGTKLTGPEYIRSYCKGVTPGVFNKKTNEVEWL